jgi:hypothetical protein
MTWHFTCLIFSDEQVGDLGIKDIAKSNAELVKENMRSPSTVMKNLGYLTALKHFS